MEKAFKSLKDEYALLWHETQAIDKELQKIQLDLKQGVSVSAAELDALSQRNTATWNKMMEISLGISKLRRKIITRKKC